ncbi:MAG: PDZ domain-containing protein [Verrucomicrobiota bacterium]
MLWFSFGGLLLALSLKPASGQGDPPLPVPAPDSPLFEPAPPSPDEKPKGTNPPPSAESLQTLIQQMGHDRFPQRQKAQEQLALLGGAYHEEVVNESLKAYVDTKDVEIRYRLRDLLKELVMSTMVEKKKGFLGIRLLQSSVPNKVKDKPPIPTIAANYVFPGSGASKAGMRVNDQIMSFDGNPVPMVGGTQAFIAYVNSKTPGTRVLFKVRRGQVDMDMPAILQERPVSLQTNRMTPARKRQYFRDWMLEKVEALKQAEPPVENPPKAEPAPEE